MEPVARPSRSWGVWAAMGAILVGVVVGVIVIVRMTAIRPITTPFGFPGFQLPIAVVFGTAGAVILRRRPGNVIGTLLLAEGVLSTLQFPVEWLPRILGETGASKEAIAWTAFAANVVWLPAVAVFGLLFALYPDGRPVSRRWGYIVPAVVAGAITAAVGLSLTPGPFYSYPDVTNPLGLEALEVPGLVSAWYVLVLLPIGLAGASLLVRWRRSTGDARAQLKWLAFVAVPFAIAGFAATVYPIASLVMIGFGALIPVAIAIAILRYRLYDIDELVSRTFVIGALTAILAGLYTAALKFFNELFLQITGTESEGAIILATLVLAAAFTPVRKSLEGLIERRLKGQHPAVAASAGPATRAATLDAAELEAIVRKALRDELTVLSVVPTTDGGSTVLAAGPAPAVPPTGPVDGPTEEPAQA